LDLAYKTRSWGRATYGREAEYEKRQLANQIKQLGGFDKGAAYLRSHFLIAKKNQDLLSSQSAGKRNTQGDADKQRALQILRCWEVAPPAIAFVTNETPVEEQEEKAAQTRGDDFRQLLIGWDSSDIAKKEALQVVSLYDDHSKECMLLRSAWQDIDVEAPVFKDRAKLAKLILLDPFYEMEYQPKESEWKIMRKILDHFSTGTVVSIFGRFQAYERWQPIFEAKSSGS